MHQLNQLCFHNKAWRKTKRKLTAKTNTKYKKSITLQENLTNSMSNRMI
uniref:Uncharacterized protein n=1 Tax=Arundo donax TaxID=35708 RepID=A0A0A9HRX4_ARUDO